MTSGTSASSQFLEIARQHLARMGRYCETCGKNTPHEPGRGQYLMNGQARDYFFKECKLCGNKNA